MNYFNENFTEKLKQQKSFFDDQRKAKKIADLIESDLLRYSEEVKRQTDNFYKS